MINAVLISGDEGKERVCETDLYCHYAVGQRSSEEQPSRLRASGANFRNTLAALGLVFCSMPALGEEKSILKVTTPTSAVRLFGADCPTNCWLSGLFAPVFGRPKSRQRRRWAFASSAATV